MGYSLAGKMTTMKVLLITGSYPPDICGVAGYTARLEESLQTAGAEVTIYTCRRWGLRNSADIAREISAISADMFHIQYPAIGYGWKLGPQLISLLRPLVVTLHECSHAHVLRQLSLYPFSLRSPRIIFTNEYEQGYAQRFAPWIKSRSIPIPIGSNIPIATSQPKHSDKIVTYFGLIRPQKGIEQLLAVARILKTQRKGYGIRIIGTVMPGHEQYLKYLRNEAQDLPVQWILGLADDELARTLAETEVAYLPFEDGASERRGSLIAMLTNRAAVITTLGRHTPSAMIGAVLVANSPDQAVVLAEEMYDNPDRRAALQLKAAIYAEKFAWDNIAADHIAIYQELMSARS